MENEIEIAALCAIIIGVVQKKKKLMSEMKAVKRRNRILWSRNWLLRRDEGRGFSSMVLKELFVEDAAGFKNCMRMSKNTYCEIRRKVCPLIIKQNTTMRESISPEIKLILTLRFLATGQKFQELAYSFRVSVPAISLFLPDVLTAIYNVLKGEFLKVPETVHEWQKIAEDFERKWNFSNCLGSIDGKHIAIRVKKSQGSLYYNYKGFNSVILMAVVDANYKFVYVSVGTNGRANDAAAFNESSLGDGIKKNYFNFPDKRELPGTNMKVPYVFVADEAFKLTDRILRPNGDRKSNRNKIFNYRLSRARRVVENAFGILANKFQVFQRDIDLEVDKVELLTLTACALHNFIRTRDGNEKNGEDVEDTTLITLTPGNWRGQVCLTGLQRASGNRTGSDGRNVREIYTEYFNSVGAVPWQNDAIQKFNF